jgi:predicted ATPase
MGDDESVSQDFVETVRIENFGCVRDAQLELTRLHALIGPNDSGKSTVLAAIRTAAELIRLGENRIQQDRFIEKRSEDPRVLAHSKIAMSWSAATIECVRLSKHWQATARTASDRHRYDQALTEPFSYAFAGPARGATLVRWDPDAIRRPCDLIPEAVALTVDERGTGLPAVYEATLSRDRSAFDGIESELRRHFPTVKGIWLPTTADSKKALGVTLTNGARVQASEMSEGLLYWLAFAILPHIDPTAILLVEEPENGLHPSRIADVMKVLRAVSTRMQVILATHSPLVINELAPEEVTILTRDPATGTRATRIDRTTHFQQRQRVYALGELWLSFADGVDETALVPHEHTSKSTG